jgi:hypothetical protein
MLWVAVVSLLSATVVAFRPFLSLWAIVVFFRLVLQLPQAGGFHTLAASTRTATLQLVVACPVVRFAFAEWVTAHKHKPWDNIAGACAEWYNSTQRRLEVVQSLRLKGPGHSASTGLDARTVKLP